MAVRTAQSGRDDAPDRLGFGRVLVRGALYGLAASAAAGIAALAVAGHQHRLTSLAVIAGVGFVVAAAMLPIGGFFWLCSPGDHRRWRDWRTLQGRYDGVSILGPAMVRLGSLGLVLGAGSLLIYRILNSAPYGSWWYGR